VYNALVKPNSIDLNRVGAHLAVSSIFQEYPEKTKVYCYNATIKSYERFDAGIQILASGTASIRSEILWEEHHIDFAVLHFGDHNLIGAVNASLPKEEFVLMQKDLENAFIKGDTTEVIRIMNIFFMGNNYSLWHLFKDQQRHILQELLATTWLDIDASFRRIYEHNYTIMQIMRGMNIPLPKGLSAPAEFIINQDLCSAIREENVNVGHLKKIMAQATRLQLQLDEKMLRFEASRKINRMMEKFKSAPEDIELLQEISSILKVLLSMIDELDIQAAQNEFFSLSKDVYPKINERTAAGDENSKKWIKSFNDLAQYLNVSV
jgi:hypothetical protein